MRALRTIALMSIMIASGCTNAQRYATEVVQHAQADMIPFRECQKGIEADPQFSALYQSLAVSTAADPFREPTNAQLSDSHIISDDDKSLFLAWFSEAQQCALPTIEDLGRLAPEIEIYFADIQADQTDLINESSLSIDIRLARLTPPFPLLRPE
jgi:hypothetical protein